MCCGFIFYITCLDTYWPDFVYRCKQMQNVQEYIDLKNAPIHSDIFNHFKKGNKATKM